MTKSDSFLPEQLIAKLILLKQLEGLVQCNINCSFLETSENELKQKIWVYVFCNVSWPRCSRCKWRCWHVMTVGICCADSHTVPGVGPMLIWDRGVGRRFELSRQFSVFTRSPALPVFSDDCRTVCVCCAGGPVFKLFGTPLLVPALRGGPALHLRSLWRYRSVFCNPTPPSLKRVCWSLPHWCFSVFVSSAALEADTHSLGEPHLRHSRSNPQLKTLPANDEHADSRANLSELLARLISTRKGAWADSGRVFLHEVALSWTCRRGPRRKNVWKDQHWQLWLIFSDKCTFPATVLPSVIANYWY